MTGQNGALKKRKADTIDVSKSYAREEADRIKRRQTAQKMKPGHAATHEQEASPTATQLVHASRSNLKKLQEYKEHLSELRAQIVKGELEMLHQKRKRAESRRLLKEMELKKRTGREVLNLQQESVYQLNIMILTIQRLVI
jgi:hypothetical protein